MFIALCVNAGTWPLNTYDCRFYFVKNEQTKSIGLFCVRKSSTNMSVLAGCEYSQVPLSLMETTRFSNNENLLKNLLIVYLQTSLKCDCDGDFHELNLPA